MSLATLLLFLPACFALNLAPGPNNLLSISNATRYGFRVACIAGIGRLLAFMLMIALVASGLSLLLTEAAWLFSAIKIAGALYLLYLGWNLWRAPVAVASAGEARCAPQAMAALLRQEFWLAAGNPKAILIFTAFLPQFVDVKAAVAPQFAVLGALFLLLEWLAVVIYAALGSQLSRLLQTARVQRVFNRGCGGLLAGAGAAMLAVR